MRFSLFLIIVFTACVAFAPAQTRDAELFGIPEAIEVRMNAALNTPAYVRMRSRSVAENEAMTWLNGLLPTSKSHWKTDTLLIEKSGVGLLKVKQYYSGLPVLHGVYTLQIENGFVTKAHGEWYDIHQLNTTPALTPHQAVDLAIEDFQHSDASSIDNGLVVMQRSGVDRLCYKIDVRSTKPLSRKFVYVDAHSGEIVLEENRICMTDVPATALTMYNGVVNITVDQTSPTSYRLQESGRGIQTLNMNNGVDYSSAVDFTDIDLLWNDPLTDIRTAYDVHFGAEVAYDYFFDEHNLLSFDGSGALIKCYANYGSGYANAFWDGDVLTFGGGNGTYAPLTSLDIVVHEFTHAVTEHSAGLIYASESGALNEAFSDIFAITTDFLTHPASADWYIGDQVGSGGIPFRNLESPTVSQDPDTYQGDNWDFIFEEVHNNSTVLSHWYYLLVNGGSGTTDFGVPYGVSGIGLDKAADIAYRTLNVYLTPSSGYADAQYYSIQAAIDLFGPCTNEVLQVTEAWNAVGLPTAAEYIIVAGFAHSDSMFCNVPSSVSFTNLSVNASSYLWSFGDGNTSTVANPVHLYSTPGTFNVTLTATGTSTCNSSDTFTVASAVTVNTGGSVSAAICIPVATNPSADYGIRRMRLHTLDQTSGYADEGYKDFTCLPSPQLQAGSTYNLKVNGTAGSSQRVNTWVDFNNDATFSTDEIILSDSSGSYFNKYVHFPYNPVLNTQLRLRVLAKDASAVIIDACDDPLYGQAEDYSVTFVSTNLPPIAAFTGEAAQASIGQPFQLFDTSWNAPTSWQWFVPGAFPESSTDRDPVFYFTEFGTYDVTLVATNTFGSDTLTIPGYIVVSANYKLCGGYSQSNVATGTLTLDSMPLAPFIDATSCAFLISVPCADTIFIQFETVPAFLTIKDGVNGNGLSLVNGSAFSTTNELYIEVPVSTATSPGFKATWHSSMQTPVYPVGTFTINGALNVNTPILFNDTSGLNITRQLWNFGDGSESRNACPVHRYTNAGSYLVIHTVWNCFGLFNITTQTVNISGMANMTMPDSIVVNLACGDSATANLIVQNTGSATLRGNILGKNVKTARYVLSHDPGSFPNPASHYANMITAVNSASPQKIIAQHFSTNPLALRDSLKGKDLLWFPEAVNSDLSNNLFYRKLSGIVREFTESGGTLLVGSHDNDLVQRINEQNLFHLQYGNDDDAPQVVAANSPFLDSVYPPYYYFSGFNYLSAAPPMQDVLHTTLNSTDRTELGYVNVGLGSAVYFGCDFSASPAAGPDRILNNAMRKAGHFGCPDWLFVESNAINTSAGSSDTIALTFYASEVAVGSHSYYLRFNTNDAGGSLDSVLIELNVTGNANMTVSDSCVAFGEVNVGAVSDDYVLVHNSGCDTLFVNASMPLSNGFSIAYSPAFILPGQFDSVAVSFSSSTAGNASAALQLQTNAYDTTVCLTATAVTPPLATYNPGSFNVSLSCGDSVTLPLTIANAGTGTLSYYLTNHEVSVNPRVLVFTDGVDMAAGGEYENVKNAILQFVPNATFTDVNTGYTTVLADSLQQKDILLFPKKESNGILDYTALSGLVQSFVSNGGTVIVCGTPTAYASRVFELGLFSGAYYNWGNTGTFTVGALNDPLLESTSAPYMFNGDVHLMNFSDADVVKVLKQGSATALSYRDIGLGRVVYTGSEFSGVANMWSQIISNAVHQGDATANGWVTTNDDQGAIPGTGFHSLDLNFYAGKFAVGTYDQTLLVQTNNPFQPFDTIALSLSVTGQATLEVSDSCTVFEPSYVGMLVYDTVYIHNAGCDTLNMASLTVTPVEFSVLTAVQDVLPYDSLPVVVSFNPTVTGNVNGDLTIGTNVGNEVVCLQASATPMPLLSLNPYAADLPFNVCRDSLDVSFTVQNTGPGTLIFSQGTNASDNDLRVLVFAYGVVDAAGFGLENVLQTVDAMAEVSAVDTTLTQSAAMLDSMLTNYDVLVFPNQDEVGVDLNPFVAAVTNFVSNGGTVIVCGSDNNPESITELGLMNAQSNGAVSNGSMKSFNTTLAVMANMPGTFIEPSYAHRQLFVNSDVNALVEEEYGLASDGKVAAYRNIGIGRVYYLGFDFANASPEAHTLLTNAIRYHGYAHFNGLQTPDTLASGDQQTITFTCYSPQDGGAYPYILNSNDPFGPDTFTLTLNGVDAACSAFTISNDCNQTVSFTASNINNATSWNWNFGDGQTSILQNPQHTYSTSGVYTATLITSNGLGSDTSQQIVVINNAQPQIQTTGNGLVGSPVQFTVTAYEGADGFDWSFGDNGTSIADTALHIYTVAAVYVVSVEVTDSNGCVNMAYDTIAILPTHVQALSGINGFFVYPNPASDFILIEVNDIGSGVTAEICDVLGRTVLQQKLAKSRSVISLQHINSGVYFLRLKRGSESIGNTKIIVQNEAK